MKGSTPHPLSHAGACPGAVSRWNLERLEQNRTASGAPWDMPVPTAKAKASSVFAKISMEMFLFVNATVRCGLGCDYSLRQVMVPVAIQEAPSTCRSLDNKELASVCAGNHDAGDLYVSTIAI